MASASLRGGEDGGEGLQAEVGGEEEDEGCRRRGRGWRRGVGRCGGG